MKLNVYIKPQSKLGPLVKEEANGLTVYVREAAVEGKANGALIKIVAKHYKVPKTSVKIAKGHSSRYKKIEIEGI